MWTLCARVWADASHAQDGRLGMGMVLVEDQGLHYKGEVASYGAPHTNAAELAALVEAISWAHTILPAHEGLLAYGDSKKAIWLLDNLLVRSQGIVPSQLDPMIRVNPNRTPGASRWKVASQGSKSGVLVDPASLDILQGVTMAAGRRLQVRHANRETLEVRLCDAMAREVLGMAPRDEITLVGLQHMAVERAVVWIRGPRAK